MTAYPLSAVVGMDDLRLALVLNAVSPAIGGVLVRGEKGTAKSTAVRGLTAMLPPLRVVADCRFACDPAAGDADCPDGPHPPEAPAVTRAVRMVELPVGASEDRVTGSIDLDRALTEGVTALRPGLLAVAHRGLLYVDEVNLLHDHLVDLLLDAAALGVAHVERDGVSVRHAARFLLVGTMNPEEGELRPQLLDRFGLTVEVAASRDPRVRAEVVRRRLAYDADPQAFAAAWAEQDAALAARIAAARDRLPAVELSETALRQVTAVCAAFDVDGMRADVVTARTAIALAAWEGRERVTADDIRRAARLALPHRRRRGPFDAPGLDEDTLADALEKAGEPSTDPDGPPPAGGGGGAGHGDAAADSHDGHAGDGPPPTPAGDLPTPRPAESEPLHRAETQRTATDAAAEPRPASGPTTASEHSGYEQPDPSRGQTDTADVRPAGPPGPTFRPRRLEIPDVGTGLGAAGRRSRARTRHGAVVTDSPEAAGLHLPATLRAAAPWQRVRGRRGPGLLLRPSDRRGAVREGREGNLVLFVVDASGSMAARARMRTVTTAVLSLLLDAYQRRDRIGMITFRGAGAEVVLPPTSSVEVGAARLRSLPTGGRTPLAAGLTRAGQVLAAERRRDPDRRALLVVVTDGRCTTGPDPAAAAHALARAGVASVVVDCESGYVRLGLAGRLATALGGTTVPLAALSAAGPAVATGPTVPAGPVRPIRPAGSGSVRFGGPAGPTVGPTTASTQPGKVA
ncbi:VWA domain-containing protein [Protofrankia sp. BMG5.30]|uniref:VWA domain-containing protein n=1 Tax=Protofrankia sp. BMG5.30 TaxID=1834514 RepID=UPI0009760FAC|nr:VWA domain-containing protein [Protofrankia sp. BMG5.30]ONH35260.1 protoporphyrin IX magnesium chelatase [Protofrankia sp. BMG5.30]